MTNPAMRFAGGVAALIGLCMTTPALGAHPWSSAQAKAFVTTSIKNHGQYLCRQSFNNGAFELVTHHAVSVSFRDGILRTIDAVSGAGTASQNISTVALSDLAFARDSQPGMNGWTTGRAVPESALREQTNCPGVVGIVLMCRADRCATSRSTNKDLVGATNVAFEIKLDDASVARKVLAALSCLIPQGNACPSD
jgi:hypothetical protein